MRTYTRGCGAWFARSYDAPVGGPSCEFPTIRQLQFAQHRRDVGLDRLDRNEQLGGDLLIRVSARYQAHDLLLAGREHIDRDILLRVIPEGVERDAQFGVGIVLIIGGIVSGIRNRRQK